jgi:hypothetical protein
MKVEIRFSEVSQEEAEHLARRLADIKSTQAPDDALAQAGSMEEVYAVNIAREVAAYVDLARDERVASLRKLGEILIQLPDEVQGDLRRQTIEAARAHDIDVSGLT